MPRLLGYWLIGQVERISIVSLFLLCQKNELVVEVVSCVKIENESSQASRGAKQCFGLLLGEDRALARAEDKSNAVD